MEKFTAQHVFINKQLEGKQSIHVESGRFLQVGSTFVPTSQDRIVDFGDTILAPGFVDIQLNGCNGVLFNQSIDQQSLHPFEAFEGNLHPSREK